ncbi:hypothetical protein ACFVS2_20340 [Brevibacillus sp. NPDC058079]
METNSQAAVISVDFDEDQVKVYKGVEVSIGRNTDKKINSGNGQLSFNE